MTVYNINYLFKYQSSIFRRLECKGSIETINAHEQSNNKKLKMALLITERIQYQKKHVHEHLIQGNRHIQGFTFFICLIQNIDCGYLLEGTSRQLSGNGAIRTKIPHHKPMCGKRYN